MAKTIKKLRPVFVVPKNQKKGIQKKVRSKKELGSYKSHRGVIQINCLPHGFYEEQLKNYFNQFGLVTRVRVARSNETGSSKGYAFVEFALPEVAEIAATTMDNKLMFRKLLKVKYIAPEEQKYDYFRSAIKIKDLSGEAPRYIATSAVRKQHNNQIKKQNATVTPIQIKVRANKVAKKMKRLQEKYKELGISLNTQTAIYQTPVSKK